MEFSQIVRSRRTHRNFLDDPIPPESLERIVFAGTRGPSAGFTQATRILVLNDPARVELFWESISSSQWREGNSARAGLDRAPCVIIPFEDQSAYLERYGEADKAYSGIRACEDFAAPFWTIDASFAAMMIQLAIVDEGLGYLFFALPFGIENLRANFAVPPNLKPIGAIALGYPAAQTRSASSRARRRIPNDQMIRYNTF